MSSLRLLLSSVLLAISFSATSAPVVAEQGTDATILGGEQNKSTRQTLIGQWTGSAGTLKLHADGTFQIGDKNGRYEIRQTTLVFISDQYTIEYQFALNDPKLTLSGGDITGAIEFTRLSRMGPLQSWRAHWSWTSVRAKIRRIVVIILIVVICQIAVKLLAAGSRLAIYSNWGPLRFVYQRHKKRTQTLHSLALNISRYVIYIVAVGFILTELGINYTMYFASLSVVGLAIGFGSQGLVQDMVTGFFIVFEEQFNVGDMVEVPPHTGIVEELGLRMTRLRNYQGQRVTIPNRNIAVVGNYTRGAQQVALDIAVGPEAEAEKVTEVVRQVVAEASEQFGDIIFSVPTDIEEIAPSAGQRFLRLELAIWPQQQWVVDQELTPRIRAAMKSNGIEIPNDKIVVFYHQREKRSLSARR